VAHSWDREPGHLRVLVATAFAFAALDASALELGDAQVRSTLGENLDLRIPVTIAKGESIQPSCFTLSDGPAASVPRISGARVSLERSAAATYLRVRTDSVVSEPALVLGVVVACTGLPAEVRRDYSLLVDPRNTAQAPVAASAPSEDVAAPAPASFPSIATLIARIGDTLASIANAIFPGNAPARQSYIQALRDANPPLATIDERDPIPLDTEIALPDLRAFARARPSPATGIVAAPSAPVGGARTTPETRAPVREAKAPAPARKRAPAAAIEPRAPATELPPGTPREAVATTRATPAASKRRETVRNQTISPGFVLKLSSGEMDLSPSRSVDDRMRAQLRDRQLVLDADDQVAAVLALRDSVRHLESRVAELQLKLAGMPSSFPSTKAVESVAPAPVKTPPQTPAAPPKPPASSPPAVAAPPAPIERAPAPSPPVPIATPPAPAAAPPVSAATPPLPVAASPLPAATPPAPAAIRPAPVVTSSAPDAAAPAVTAPDKAEPPPPPAAAPSGMPAPVANKAPQPSAEIDWLYYGLWALAFLLAAAAILLAVRLARRRRNEAEYEAGEHTRETEGAPPDDEIVVALEPFGDDARHENEFDDDPEPPRRALDADVDIATRLPDNDAGDLRQRYIEERFPEIGKGAIVIDDPDSVVKGARLFYEDRAIARAVELLTFAIERHPGEVKSWLALFEIYRLEALPQEFADLARRFREQHGKSDYWRKVQYFGREIDPGNDLYAEKAFNTFETIGPAQAKRLADSSFDPIAENWLGAPMDFQNEVLANELRMALMATAGISESDLVPNPMPALRNVEMFTVA
jgi:pilus assembly protein FimV